MASPPFAPWHDRVAAFAIDATLLISSSPVTLGVAAVVLRGLWPAAAFAIAMGYLAVSYSTGQTIGMHVVHIHLASSRGGPPGLVAALVRSVLVVLPVGVALVLAFAHGSGLSPLAQWAGLLTVVTGSVDHAWMVGDHRHRALHDVLTGVVVRSVREPR